MHKPQLGDMGSLRKLIEGLGAGITDARARRLDGTAQGAKQPHAPATDKAKSAAPLNRQSGPS